MKHFEVYVYMEGEFVSIFQTRFANNALCYVRNKDLSQAFFLIKNITLDDKDGSRTHVNSKIFLGGVQIYKSKNEIKPEYIETLKKKLTTIFKTDGSRMYFPDGPFTTPEVIDICGGWFTELVVEVEPRRRSIFFFSDRDKERPAYNHQASQKFGRTLYGDVLFIEENFIS